MNIQFSNDAKQMKYEVLVRVAGQCYNGELEEKRDEIPYEIIPGNEARYRCCVYKEREIIRERVSAAMGKLPRGAENRGAVVSVLPAACEGCPINRYTVTENCQRCMARKCVAACPFNAITVTGKGAYIDPSKCKECGRCAAACPYNAISDTMRPCLRSCPVDAISIDPSKRAMIKEDRCIGCGACTNDCPFGAITDLSEMTQVIGLLKQKKNVVAVVAPAIEGQFGNANIAMLVAAIKQLGFADAFEVALGADAVAAQEAKEVRAAALADSHLTTACCSAFVSMIRKHFPKLLPYMSETVSPMGAVARYIKQQSPGTVVVFIGPCIAKKQELENPDNGVDHVLTFEELCAMFAARGIDPEHFEGDLQEASLFGKGFAVSGGVAGAVLQALEEAGQDEPVSYQKCNGARECKKALAMLNAGKFDETLLEGMACENGCVSGPCALVPLKLLQKRRDAMLKAADGRTIGENLRQFDFTGINLKREPDET